MLPGKPGARASMRRSPTSPGDGQGISDSGPGLSRTSPRAAHGSGPGASCLSVRAPLIQAKVFSVLEVDEMVERYASSAAPSIHRELRATGAEGLVRRCT